MGQLFFDDLFYLPDFLLNLAGNFLRSSFVLKIRIVCRMADFFLHGSLNFVKLAFSLR